MFQQTIPSPPNTYLFPYGVPQACVFVPPQLFTQEDCSIFGNQVRQEVEHSLLSLGEKNTHTLQTRCEISYLLHHIVHEKYCTASYNSPVFRCENKIASCVPSNNHDSSYRTDTEAQILCLQTVPETHYWGNYFCALRLTPGCRVNPRWVNCLLTGDGAGPECFSFFPLPTVKMLLIGKQKPEIELTVGLLRPGQGHKSLTKVNRQ